MIIESYSTCNFESENNNFQSKKLISGGVIGLRKKCCRTPAAREWPKVLKTAD